MTFDYEEERPFYCEKVKKNCPFKSRFRYCFDCYDLQELADDYDANKEDQHGKTQSATLQGMQ